MILEALSSNLGVLWLLLLYKRFILVQVESRRKWLCYTRCEMLKLTTSGRGALLIASKMPFKFQGATSP